MGSIFTTSAALAATGLTALGLTAPSAAATPVAAGQGAGPTITSAVFIGTVHHGRRCLVSVRGTVPGSRPTARVRLVWAGGASVGAGRARQGRFAVAAVMRCRPGLLVPQLSGGVSGVAIGLDLSRHADSWSSALGRTVTLTAAVAGPEGPYVDGTAPASCPNTQYAPGEAFVVLDLRTKVVLARGALGPCTFVANTVVCDPDATCAPGTVSPSYAIVPDRPLPLASAAYLVEVGTSSFAVANPLAYTRDFG